MSNAKSARSSDSTDSGDPNEDVQLNRPTQAASYGPPNILIVNGSLGGANGNTAQVLNKFCTFIRSQDDSSPEDRSRCPQISILNLSNGSGGLSKTADATLARESLQKADAFVFASGTYWDSWGSPMQYFFETATDLEASDVWLGKPAACLVTMHSVGGKEVLSRMQGVLNTLGLFTPPMSGLTYSLANHLALQTTATDFHSDFWHLNDLNVVATNLLYAITMSRESRSLWKPWPVDESDPRRRWL